MEEGLNEEREDWLLLFITAVAAVVVFRQTMMQ
jgi:hypothetical protein